MVSMDALAAGAAYSSRRAPLLGCPVCCMTSCRRLALAAALWHLSPTFAPTPTPTSPQPPTPTPPQPPTHTHHPPSHPPCRRIMFAAALGPALLQSATLALCPESPAWLLRVGRADRAARALRRLHGPAFRPEDHHPKVRAAAAAATGQPAGMGAATGGSRQADAEQPLLGSLAGPGEGQAELQPEAEHLGWGALRAPRYRRVMVLAAALPLAQQASGINTVIFFSTQVGCVAGRQMPQGAPGVGAPHLPDVVWNDTTCVVRSAVLRLCQDERMAALPAGLQVFQQAGLQSPILGSIAMGATNLGGCGGLEVFFLACYICNTWKILACCSASSLNTHERALPAFARAAFTVVAALLMDRAGRRVLLLTSFAGMAACLAALAAVMRLPSELGQAGPGQPSGQPAHVACQACPASSSRPHALPRTRCPCWRRVHVGSSATDCTLPAQACPPPFYLPPLCGTCLQPRRRWGGPPPWAVCWGT